MSHFSLRCIVCNFHGNAADLVFTCCLFQLEGSDEESQVGAPDEDSTGDAPVEQTSSVSASSPSGTKSASKLSKSAKKRQKKKEKKSEAVVESDDDLDELLASLPKTEQDVEAHKVMEKNTKLREILKLNSSLLDPDAEMQRLFGSEVVPNRGNAQHAALQQNQQRIGRVGRPGARTITVRKKTLLVKPRPSWPPVNGKSDGLEMILQETRKGVSYFKFTWSADYERAQEKFHHCVETGDPNSLAALMRGHHPYHIDTLLQLHDAFQMTDEKDAAMDLLERIIYRFECGFHPKFDIFAPDASTSIRFQYQEPENRSFMLGMLSYIQEIGKKGCSQTALEWTKLMLALDPSDPLGLLLLVDHFALRRREHMWLLRFYNSPLFEEHDLSILPNFVYSIALAAFYHRRNLESGELTKEEETSEYKDLDPTELLHNAMAMHPSLFVGLVTRLASGSIRAKGQNVLEALPHFSNATTTVLPIVNVLCQLYIERNHSMWKDPACVQWLKDSASSFYLKLTGQYVPIAKTSSTPTSTVGQNATSSSDAALASTIAEELQSKIDSYTIITQSIAENTTRIHRHVMISEFNNIIRMLPSEVLRNGFHIYSPGEIGAPRQAAAPLAPQDQPGAAGQIARILDYLVPFQADPQQLQNVLNLIGYRIDAGGGDQNEGDEALDESDEE